MKSLDLVRALARRAGLSFGPELVLMLGRSVGFAATFCIPVVLVRVFNVATFGTYKQLFLVYSTLYFVAQAGMAESLFYFVPSSRERGGRYVANATLSLGLLGLACALLLGWGARPIAAWMNNPALAPYLPWIGVLLLLMLLDAGFEIVLIARGRYNWAAWSYVLSDLLRALLFIVPALVTGRLVWVLAGGVTFGILRVSAMLAYFSREFKFKGELAPSRTALRTQLAYALPFGAAVLMEVLQGNLHQYVISARFDAATFAIYAIGCLQIPFVDFVAGPAGNVMMVHMGEKLAAGDGQAVTALWHQTTVRLASVFFPLVALCLVLARDLIVVLFTSAYSASVPIFMAWCLSILFSSLQTDGVLRVYAATRFILLVNIVRLVLILVSIVWFLKTFGLLGAVFVTLTAIAVAKIMMLVKMKRLLKSDLRGLLPWRALLTTAALASIAAAPAWIVNRVLDAHPLAGLIAAGTTYVVAYLCARAWVQHRTHVAGGPGEALGAVRLVGG